MLFIVMVNEPRKSHCLAAYSSTRVGSMRSRYAECAGPWSDAEGSVVAAIDDPLPSCCEFDRAQGLREQKESVVSGVRKNRKSVCRKAQLIEVATKIFLEKGFKETGIETILSQAGLTGSALYRHFSSKQDMLDTICINAAQRTLQLCFEVEQERAKSGEKLATLIRRRLDYLFSPRGNESFLAVNHRAHLSDDARGRILAMQREYGDIFSKFLKTVRPDLSDNERRLVFFSIQNMMLHSIWRSKDRSLLSDEEQKKLLEKMIWSTIMAREAERI
jgi:AcrR family transcriptional regulator